MKGFAKDFKASTQDFKPSTKEKKGSAKDFKSSIKDFKASTKQKKGFTQIFEQLFLRYGVSNITTAGSKKQGDADFSFVRCDFFRVFSTSFLVRLPAAHFSGYRGLLAKEISCGTVFSPAYFYACGPGSCLFVLFC